MVRFKHHNTDLIDIRQHVCEAGGEDDAAPEADAGGEEDAHQRRLRRLGGGQPAAPHPQQRQHTCTGHIIGSKGDGVKMKNVLDCIDLQTRN